MDQVVGLDCVDEAVRLQPRIAAAGPEIDQTRRIPPALLAELHRARLFRMLLPRRFGGEEITPQAYLAALTEVSRADASVGWNVFLANSSVLMAAFLAPESAHAIYDDPRGLIASGPNNASEARAVPGGYRLTGSWSFASGCRAATWLGAHVPVREPDGSLRIGRHGRPLLRSLYFPVAQARIEDTWHTLGLRGTASDTVVVEDIFVPEAFATTREEPESRREPGPLYAFPMQTLYAVGVAAVALGTAQSMLDEFRALAMVKSPRGLARLADSSVVQSGLAQNTARLGAARTWLRAMLDEAWGRAQDGGIIPLEDRAAIRLATAHGIRSAAEVADYAHHAAGVDGIFQGSTLERRFRDMHTLTQQTQARTAHFEAVGKVLLGHDMPGFY